jgi:Sugar diacid utilization regulator
MSPKGEKYNFLYELISSLVQGKDIPYLTLLLARNINCPVMVTDRVNRIISYHDLVGSGPKVKGFFPITVNLKDSIQNDFSFAADFSDIQFHQGQFEEEGRILNYCFLEIWENKSFQGCLIMFINLRKLETLSMEIISSAALTISLVLKNAREKRNENEQFQDEFIRDVLYNNYESKASISAKASLWNWKFGRSLDIAVMDMDPNKLIIARELGPLLFNGENPIYALINNQLVIILNLDGITKSQVRGSVDKFFNEFSARLKDVSIDPVRLGIGLPVDTITELYKSYQEAKVALELGRVFDKGTSCYFEDMGFLKFIFTQPAKELQDYYQLNLGDLITYDLKIETDLVSTLSTYINCNCQVSECAKTLYIHENTLRNRLKKIEQVCGHDLRRIDHILNLYIALQISKLGDEVRD